MGLFSKRAKHVQVVFKALDRAHLPGGGSTAYTYAWPLKGHPNIGDWVVVPGGDGRDATAVIVATNTTPPRGMRIANVTDRVPAHEVEQAKTANISRDKQRTRTPHSG